MGVRKWFESKSELMQATIIAGIFGVTAAAVGAAITGGFGLVTSTSQASPQPNGRSSRPAASTSASAVTPTAVQPSPGEPLNFHNIQEYEQFGPTIPSVVVTGTVPAGERAWILVKSTGDYYIQGALRQSPSSSKYWTISVSLGGTTGPFGAYTIYPSSLTRTRAASYHSTYENTDLAIMGFPKFLAEAAPR